MLNLGDAVKVKEVCSNQTSVAIIAGSRWSNAGYDIEGKLIWPEGFVYQVRYTPKGGLYNFHESRVELINKGDAE